MFNGGGMIMVQRGGQCNGGRMVLLQRRPV